MNTTDEELDYIEIFARTFKALAGRWPSGEETDAAAAGWRDRRGFHGSTNDAKNDANRHFGSLIAV